MKTSQVLAALLAVLALSACEAEEKYEAANRERRRVYALTNAEPLYVYTDPDTANGCQYLRASGGGITPRMSPEGRHICKPLKDPQ